MTISYRLQMMGDTWVKCNSNLIFKLVPLHGHLFLVWLMRHLVPWLMALPLVLHTVRWAVKSHVQEENFTEAPNGSNILGTHKSQTSPRNKSLFCFFKKNTSPQLSDKSSVSAMAFLHPCFGAALWISACFPSILRVRWM